MSQSKNVLFLMTGSIACYKACNVLSKLKQNGYSVKVVMSRSSLEFVGTATVEGLTGQAPITDMYQAGNVMDHINLVRWANLIIAAPATANFINKISAGLGDDLLTTLFLAHDFEKPFLIAPAMNTKMYLHPATQESVQKLKKMPLLEILETASGVLACGEVGSGRLLEPDLIYNEISKHFKKSDINSAIEGTTSTVNTKADNSSLSVATPNIGTIGKTSAQSGLKVLVTGGGTSENIDDVRVITNKSTGRTAAFICERLAEAGVDVTYVKAQTAVDSLRASKKLSYQSFQDLQTVLKSELSEENYDMVIHAAAVSDYSPEVQIGKMNSDADEITLKLKRNPKIINQIKQWAPNTKLVGFKLTSKLDEKSVQAKVDKLFELAKCDFVVQNDWNDIQSQNNNYKVFSIQQSKQAVTVSSLDLLAAFLFQNLITKENL
jgi:phosphopantothenoylcysteine decarboxylase / phosphopantothenate---cysteine ligase